MERAEKPADAGKPRYEARFRDHIAAGEASMVRGRRFESARGAWERVPAIGMFCACSGSRQAARVPNAYTVGTGGHSRHERTLAAPLTIRAFAKTGILGLDSPCKTAALEHLAD